MMEYRFASRTTKALFYVLLGVHGFLVIWALIGFAEWIFAHVPWPAVSNELFPRNILFMQWSMVLAAGLLFIGGYAARWAQTPVAMACIYSAMATLCAVQTFNFMDNDMRFTVMSIEYITYLVILVFLFRSDYFKASHGPENREPRNGNLGAQ